VEQAEKAGAERLRLLLLEIAGVQEELDGIVTRLRRDEIVPGIEVARTAERLRRARSRLHATMEEDRRDG
jgi:hypothetical protein